MQFHTAIRPGRDWRTVVLLKRQDPEGLRQLLADHGARVQLVLLREFQELDRADVDEILNTAALRAWRSARSYDDRRGPIDAWFYVIARRVALDVARTRRTERRCFRLRETDFAALADRSCGDPASVVDGELFADVLLDCIHRLPPFQRRVLRADLESRAGVVCAGELATHFGTSVNAVYVARALGRRALRRRLRALGYVVDKGRRSVEPAERAP